MLFQQHLLTGAAPTVSLTYTATDWLFPTSMSQVNAGAGTVAWAGTGNIGADDGSNATCVLNVQASQYLRGSSFDFAGQSIPGGATITGVEARISRYQTDAGAQRDLNVLLADYTDFDPLSLNRAKPDSWPTTETLAVYGGQNDTWGLTLTKALLETSSFALLLLATRDVGSTVLAVNYMQLRAHYYF